MRSCAYSLEFHEKFLTKLLEPKAAGEMRHFLAALRAPPLVLYHYMIIIIVIYYYHYYYQIQKVPAVVLHSFSPCQL